MICKKCGARIPDTASFCPSCGYPTPRAKRPSAALDDQPQQQAQAQPTAPPPGKNYAAPAAQDNLDWSSLTPYYYERFLRIYKSGGNDAGGFNWAAFFFNWIWLLVKGCWLAGLVWLIALVVAGAINIILPLIICILVGVRGNNIYYHAFVKNQQVIW